MTDPAVGTRYAFMLPPEFINPYKTPGKGMVVQDFFNSTFLVLVEEVWQYAGDGDPFMLRDTYGLVHGPRWGWCSVPEILGQDEFIVKDFKNEDLFSVREDVINLLIKDSINDFLTKGVSDV